MNFQKFKQAVATRFVQMAKHQLFRVELDRNELWDVYINSFPVGSNPMFRERTEHDCNCCKAFIRTIGNVVAVVDGKLLSIWDIKLGADEPEYQTVANAMSALVYTRPIVDLFRHYEPKVGTDKSFEAITGGKAETWDHFFVTLPKQYVLHKDVIAPKLGEVRSTVDVFTRSLKELSIDSLDTVLELISQNSLYRGAEHTYAVTEFKKLKKSFDKITEQSARNNMVWVTVADAAVPASVLKFRNTVIGTLVSDLAEGKSLEDSVKSFESKVAPQNYKRPTALVTKAMIERAKQTVDQLGLTSALNRRYAVMSDITINNVLFANRSTKSVINNSVFDLVADQQADALDAKTLAKVETMSIDAFVANVLPLVDTVEVLVENQHQSRLVSLVTSVDPTAGQLFKWSNPFSWSYAGDVTDSIKERVKQAGGNVTGDVCCRLAWFNHDDLDFHMVEPGGYEISFRTRSMASPSSGRLDVDMNAGGGATRTPVENIFYPTVNGMKPGRYELFVHNFAKRETKDVGFEVEIDIMGTIHRYSHTQALGDGKRVTIATLTVDGKGNVTVDGELTSSTRSATVWGVQTNTFVPVNMVLSSPNHWDGQGVGNKHFFFMLKGCQNEDTARGFYNEFIKEELNPHRKVLEMVGSKVRTDESNDQLSGIGFSSTQRGELVCRVKGKFTRIVKIAF